MTHPVVIGVPGRTRVRMPTEGAKIFHTAARPGTVSELYTSAGQFVVRRCALSFYRLKTTELSM